MAALEVAEPLSAVPERALAATGPADIQFDISAFLSAPPNTYGSGVLFQMPPVHTVFLTAALHRTPVKADQAELNRVLAALEQYYPWGAAHLVTFLGYGLPYFGRFPGGAKGSLVSGHMPRLASDHARYVLEEAQAGPTDVSPSNPGVRKRRYNVDVVIEPTTCCSRCAVIRRASSRMCLPGSAAATRSTGTRSPRRPGTGC